MSESDGIVMPMSSSNHWFRVRDHGQPPSLAVFVYRYDGETTCGPHVANEDTSMPDDAWWALLDLSVPPLDAIAPAPEFEIGQRVSSTLSSWSGVVTDRELSKTCRWRYAIQTDDGINLPLAILACHLEPERLAPKFKAGDRVVHRMHGEVWTIAPIDPEPNPGHGYLYEVTEKPRQGRMWWEDYLRLAIPEELYPVGHYVDPKGTIRRVDGYLPNGNLSTSLWCGQWVVGGEWPIDASPRSWTPCDPPSPPIPRGRWRPIGELEDGHTETVAIRYRGDFRPPYVCSGSRRHDDKVYQREFYMPADEWADVLDGKLTASMGEGAGR